MHSWLLELLVCPVCKNGLMQQASALYCPSCAASYPVIRDIARFVGSDGYANSFSTEWAKHSNTLLDSVSGLKSSEDIFFKRSGFCKNDLKDKLILDAGCGAGRFMEIVQRYGARVAGLDISFSVEQARINVPGADVIQADLLRPPLKADSFDMVFSIGVLHHTPDAEQAFRNIASLVKPGGKLAVWLYARDGVRQQLYNAVAALYRTATTRMSQKTLYQLCRLSIPLYYLHRTPFGVVSRALLPTSMEIIPEWRILDTFDWYSPKYQSKHSYAQVRSWFDTCGFSAVTNLPFPTSMIGTKG